ncbi:MAG: 30S ribosomal protein S8 [Planctomycetes bacterium]|nr:30S ribosomal protein S8 [Planctomycetota bacterium]
MTDPIADLLTQIRNGVSNQVKRISVPYSKTKKAILKVLKENGYIADFVSEMVPAKGGQPVAARGGADRAPGDRDSGVRAPGQSENKKAVLRIELKYGPDGEKIIRHIRRISKPGRRVYSAVGKIADPLNGLGLAVLSTSKGIMSQLEAKKLNVGGEVLCEIW